MDVKTFRGTVKTLTRFSGAADLFSEIGRGIVPPHLQASTVFVGKELKDLGGSLVAARIRCRENAPRAPLPRRDPTRILVVSTSDWIFKIPPADLPQNAINGCNFVEIRIGGLHPHLACPDVIIKLLKEHIPISYGDAEQGEEDGEDEY
jgi:hypothetical protein